MSYVQNTMMSDEKLVYLTKPHWIIFSSTLIWVVISIALFGFGARLGMDEFNIAGYQLHAIFALIALIIAIYQIISAYLFYISSEYAVTDKRVLMKTGLIQRHSLEIFLAKIESINANQGIWGRILNYGTIIICGTGGSKDHFDYIPLPLHFRKLVQEQVETTLQ